MRVYHRIYPFALLLSTAVVAPLAQSEVYKSVTPDGQVVYTDNADNAYQASKDATKITVLDKLTSLTPTASNTTQATQETTQNLSQSESQQQASQSKTVQPQSDSQPSTANVEPNVSKVGDYRLFINKPEKDMTYRRVTQSIDVDVTSQPALKTGDRFVYAVNGKHFATTQNNQVNIPTDQYDPGQYVLTVKIENVKGEVLTSVERPFYILSNNFAIQNKRKAAAAAKAAYDKLPWYKKLKVNINL